MSTAALAFLVGLTVLLAALFIVVVMWWREATQLSRLVAATTRTEATEKLAGALGDGAVVLEQALTSKRAVDEGLAAAIATVCQAPLGAPLLQGLAIDTLLVLGALAPFLAALLGSAEAIAGLPQAVGRGEPYVVAVGAIPAAFAGIAQGAQLSSLLVLIAGVVAVCRYALLRPEARESRALRALVQATATSAPDTRVPQSSKLLALLAPTASLRAPVFGSVLFVVMSGAAVAAVSIAAPLRAANTVPLTYLRWPELYVESAEVAPPPLAAGRALQRGPSLIFGRDQVQIGANVMTDLERGALPAGWTQQALVPPQLAGSRPLVVAGETTSFATVYGVLTLLTQAHGVVEHQLVVRRHPPVLRSPARRIQAALPVLIGDASTQPVVLDLDATTVRLDGEPLDLTRADGIRQLRTKLGSGAARIGVRTHGELTYGRLLAVLGIADGLCDGGVDCGLPGRGITAVLTQAPPAE